MQVQNIPINDIVPNSYNPNVLDDEFLSYLKRSIQRDGFLQPIIVRIHPEQKGKFEIIDGEHRYKILMELGSLEVPSVVVESDDNLARIQTINMNNLRGYLDTIKLSAVVASLQEKYSNEEISSLLFFDTPYIESLLSINAFDPSSFQVTDLEETELRTAMDEIRSSTIFEVLLSSADLEIVDAAFEEASKESCSSIPADSLKYILSNYPFPHEGS